MKKTNIKNRCELFDFLLTQIISFWFILVLFDKIFSNFFSKKNLLKLTNDLFQSFIFFLLSYLRILHRKYVIKLAL